MSFRAGVSGGNRAEITILTIVIRKAELRRVGNVGAFRAELQLIPFRKGEVLEDGEVQGARRRPVIRLKPEVSACQRSGRQDVSGVKPLAWVASISRGSVWICTGNQSRLAPVPNTLAAAGV